MIFKNKVFDALKWINLIAIPAFATAYSQLAGIFGWPYGEQIAKVAVIISTLLGALLGISNYQYYKQIPKPDESVYTLDGYDVEESDDKGGQG